MSEELVRLKVISSAGNEASMAVARLIEVDGVPFDHTKLQMNALTGEDIAHAFNIIDGRITELESIFNSLQEMMQAIITISNGSVVPLVPTETGDSQ